RHATRGVAHIPAADAPGVALLDDGVADSVSANEGARGLLRRYVGRCCLVPNSVAPNSVDFAVGTDCRRDVGAAFLCSYRRCARRVIRAPFMGEGFGIGCAYVRVSRSRNARACVLHRPPMLRLATAATHQARNGYQTQATHRS